MIAKSYSLCPRELVPPVRVETLNGNLQNDFGLKVHEHKYMGAEMRGEIGGGDVDVRIETGNDGIEIRRSGRAK